MTQEKKVAIFEEYKDRRNRVFEIAERYGIQRSDVTSIAVEMGAEPRRPQKFGKNFKREQKRVCPKCKKTFAVKGARYCCFCGSDVRSNAEILIERIDKASPKILLLPQSERDEMLQLFIAITEELKKI